MTDARHKFKQWLTETALPVWSRQGFDRVGQRFAERLNLDGEMAAGVPFRLMVQARQIASFAMAALNGYGPSDASGMVRAACETMIGRYWQADGAPGWVFAVNNEGIVTDARRDTYAHAFVMFALSWAYRLAPPDSPESDARACYRRLADEMLGFLDDTLAVSGAGFRGYRTALPDPGGLSQNPHMHLFEALLSWFEATGETAFSSRTQALADLALERMIEPETGALLEFHDDHWSPAAAIAEPGHCHEWAWLLLRHERLSGFDMTGPAERLYRFALGYGEDDDGLLVDQILANGSVHQRGKRVWPQTEALKADAAFARRGDREAQARIEKRVDRLFDQFLDQPFAGGWIDHREANGAPRGTFVPASTLYHLAFAVEALDPDATTSACR